MTAASFTRTLPFVMEVVRKSGGGSAIYGLQLEAAILGMLADQPRLMRGDESPHRVANELANHMQVHMKSARMMFREDANPADGRFTDAVNN